MIELRFRRPLQHQTDSTAIEECQSGRRFEEQLQPQLFLIKQRCPLHIFRADGDLPETGNSDSRCGCAHDLRSKSQITSEANYLQRAKSSGCLYPGKFVSGKWA